MKKILDFRAKLSRENKPEGLKALKVDVESYLSECLFPVEKETLEDLIDDIEIKMDLLLEGKKIDVEKVENPLDFRSNLVESIIPSLKCTLYIENNCSLREIEREAIRVALTKNENNRTATAKELGISIRTLRNKLNEYLRNGEVAVYELSRVR